MKLEDPAWEGLITVILIVAALTWYVVSRPEVEVVPVTPNSSAQIPISE